jgi:hypothetical protein
VRERLVMDRMGVEEYSWSRALRGNRDGGWASCKSEAEFAASSLPHLVAPTDLLDRKSCIPIASVYFSGFTMRDLYGISSAVPNTLPRRIGAVVTR